MTADPVYIFLLVVIVFLLYMIVREREAAAVAVAEPTIIERVVGPTNYLPNRFYGGYPGDVWFHGPRPHYRHFWGPHINPGRRYF
jgi:hypothetical protein